MHHHQKKEAIYEDSEENALYDEKIAGVHGNINRNA